MDLKIPPAEQLLDTIPCGLVSFDTNGLVWYCNQAFQDFIRYTADEIVGQKIERVLTLPGRVFFQTHLMPLLRLQTTVEEVYVNFKTKDGQSLPMLLNGRRVGEGDQLIIHCTCFPLNHRSRYEEQLLQEKREAEISLQSRNDEQVRQELEREKNEHNRHLRELKDRNKELLQFQKLISHDMSEHIRKIKIFTQRLFQASEHTYTPVQKRHRTTIGTSVDKILHLLSNLSQFIALSERNEKPDIVDLNAIIRQAFASVQSRYPGVPARLVLDQIPPIKAYFLQIENLFVQLVDNSFKFGQEQTPPNITITSCILPYNSWVEKPDEYKYRDYLQILYTDNSQGFDEKYREEVFVLMNRITHESTGGLGLPFSKKIVNNHHGFITINSAVDKGVQIKIYLPVQQP